MSSIKATARLAGAVYFVMAIMNVLSFTQAFGAFVVGEDPAATMQKIADHEMAYRLAIVNDFVAHVLFIFLVVTLYDLFRDVNRKHAMLMLLFVVVPVAGQLANLVGRMVPLTLLRDTGVLSEFTAPERNSLATGFLRLHGNATLFAVPFWGLWLFPFGRLVIRSGFFPRVLGILMMVAGVGYVVVGLTSIVFPDQASMVSRVMMPLYFGELPIVFWLLIKGAKEPLPTVSTSGSVA